jgi:enoyl-CoA hydratase/carnithine racemase
MPYETLAVEATGGVLELLLDRPAQRNAMSLRMVDDAAQVFAQAARGPQGLEGMTALLHKRAPAWAAE